MLNLTPSCLSCLQQQNNLYQNEEKDGKLHFTTFAIVYKKSVNFQRSYFLLIVIE